MILRCCGIFGLHFKTAVPHSIFQFLDVSTLPLSYFSFYHKCSVDTRSCCAAVAHICRNSTGQFCFFSAIQIKTVETYFYRSKNLYRAACFFVPCTHIEMCDSCWKGRWWASLAVSMADRQSKSSRKNAAQAGPITGPACAAFVVWIR